MFVRLLEKRSIIVKRWVFMSAMLLPFTLSFLLNAPSPILRPPLQASYGPLNSAYLQQQDGLNKRGVLLADTGIRNESGGVGRVIADMKEKAAVFSQKCETLRQTLNKVNPKEPNTVSKALSALLACRVQYKQLEYFLEYFLMRSARVYNGPPKVEFEESESGYPEPVGFQQIEALLYSKEIGVQKEKLLAQANVIGNGTQELPVLLGEFETSDRQVLQSLRLELIRVMTLGITGYDAPLLKSGLKESYYALLSVQTALNFWLNKRPSPELSQQLKSTIDFLGSNKDFDQFDRMQFLTEYALPLQEQLSQYIRACGLELSTSKVFNEQARNLFSPQTFNKEAFDAQEVNTKPMILLGKALFFEKDLSGPASRSCATCHQPERYFTDGLPTSLAINGRTHVLRNAPTLLYAGFQYKQFWDARANSLTEQIKEVLTSKEEMAGDTLAMRLRLTKSSYYQGMFKRAFPATGKSLVSFEKIAKGIAAYVASLSPQNSDFDRYMAGEKKALSEEQIRGFNLFMGKAQCATCHFAPLFNGLVPPLYQTTEMEILGVPRTDDPKKVEADLDEGRYRTLPVSVLKGAFKTPALRNVAKTGPYMHNGSFHTLEKVMDFYNAGGGKGWRLSIPEQTLSSDSLRLSSSESKAIIRFLESLTDKNLTNP